MKRGIPKAVDAIDLRESAARVRGALLRLRGRLRARFVPREQRDDGWVDIVIPVHNVAHLVDATIRSALAQDRWRVRLIVIDDSSSDATSERVRRWAARDSRVELERVAFNDVNATRNHGLDKVRGEFVAFLDGDDILRPGALRDLVASLEGSGSDFAVGGYDRLEGRRRVPPAFWIDEAHAQSRQGVSIEQFPLMMVNAVQWTKLYRHEFWVRAGLRFPEGGHFQDQLVSARAFARATSVDVLARKVVDWRVRADGSSMTQQGVRPGQVRDRFATALAAVQVLTEESSASVRRARISQFLANDAAIATSELPRMGSEAFGNLRHGLAELSRLADPEIWREVPAEAKVLFELVLRGDRARAETYIERGGLDSLRHPLIERDGELYIELPFWGDDEAAVPLDRFLAAPREIRAYAALGERAVR